VALEGQSTHDSDEGARNLLLPEWFKIRFYPLVQDPCGEEISVVLQQNPEFRTA
jgi:hypothetical protein